MLKRIKVSDNRRFLVTEDDEPFFWLGDTAWELFHRCALEDAAFYLENRRRKEINVVQAVILAEVDGLHTPNANGDLPLIGDDPTQLNAPYFQHVDAVIDLAAEKGIYIGLLPTWGDKVNLQWGKGPVIFDRQTAYAYGRIVGDRYRNRTNIIWVMGGDRDEVTEGVDYAPVWRAMTDGIRDGVGGHTLMTYHPRGGRSSSRAFHDDTWLDVNMWQSGHMEPDIPNWELITQDYQRTPIKPVLDGEPNYEDHPINPFTRQWLPEYGYFRDYDVRKQAYRAVFAGACGHTYGHHSVWQFYTPERQPINFPYCTWQEALDRPGVSQLKHLRRLMLSRPYLNRIPDQNLIVSDVGERGQHIRATRADDGSYAMIYVPDPGRVFEINFALLSGDRLTAWWYNPRSGEASRIGIYARHTDRTFERFTTPPDEPDWVLVLDDDTQDFLPPGMV